MKAFLVFAIVCFLPLPQALGQAKPNSRSGYANWFCAAAGTHIPLGSFSKKDPSNQNAGLALPGFGYTFDIGIRSYENVGILFSGFGGYNGINDNALRNGIPADSASSVMVNTEGWRYFGILGGVYVKLPKEKSPFYLKLQMGIIDVFTPVIGYSATAPNGDYFQFNKSSIDGRGFVYGGGGGFSYPVYKNMSLGACIDFWSATARFEGVKYTSSGTGMQPVNEKRSYTTTMSYLSAKLTLVFLIR